MTQSLLVQISSLDDQQLKRDYLNHLKWTECIREMLPLMEDVQALRLVRLALEVDWKLAAELAGAVKKELQVKTVGWIIELEIPDLVKVDLLKRTKSEAAIPFLEKLLTIEEPRLSALIAEKLYFKDFDKQPDWEELKDEFFDSRTSSVAVEVLGEIGGEKATTLLIEALHHNPRKEVQESAVEALGKIGGERAIAVLIEALNDEDFFYNALYALEEIKSPLAINALVNKLDSSDNSKHSDVFSALGEIGGELAEELLIHALCDQDYWVRQSAARALIKCNINKVLESFLYFLQSKDTDIRIKVVSAFERTIEIPLSYWLKAFKDKDVRVRSKAVSSILYILREQDFEVSDEDKKLVERVLTKALKDKSYLVRLEAHKRLARIARESHIPVLLEALQDKNSDVRTFAVRTLGRLGSPQAQDGIIQALQDKYTKVRASAAAALGRINNESIIPVLVALLQDKSPEVREGAVNGLGALKSMSVIPTLKQVVFEDENELVREMAVLALENIGGREAEEILIEVLLKEERYTVCDKAAYALGTIGGEKAVDALHEASFKTEGGCADDSVLETIIEALGGIGTDSAMEAMLAQFPSHTCLDGFIGRSINTAGSLKLIPRLWQLQCQAKMTYMIDAIACIQERYQYYNPKLCTEEVKSVKEESWYRPRKFFP